MSCKKQDHCKRTDDATGLVIENQIRSRTGIFIYIVLDITYFFWVLFGAGAGCLGLFALFGFGTVLILLLQGYPLAGAVLICLGAFLASGSLAGICFGMLRGRGRRVQAAAEKVLEKEPEKEPGMDEEVLS